MRPESRRAPRPPSIFLPGRETPEDLAQIDAIRSQGNSLPTSVALFMEEEANILLGKADLEEPLKLGRLRGLQLMAIFSAYHTPSTVL